MERFKTHRRPREDEESQVDLDLSDSRWPLDLDIRNIITIILQNDAKEGERPEKVRRIGSGQCILDMNVTRATASISLFYKEYI